MQEERAAQVVRDMKRLRFIPISWSPDQSKLPAPAAAAAQQLSAGGREAREEKKGRPQPGKLEKLRDYLMNIEKTPVRRVRPSKRLSLSLVC